MGWKPQPKDKDWLNGYKNKTSIYIVYKRPASKQETHTDWKWRAGKRYSMQIETKSREGDGTPLQYSCLENPMDRGAW